MAFTVKTSSCENKALKIRQTELLADNIVEKFLSVFEKINGIFFWKN